jgi:hypothetical protein
VRADDGTDADGVDRRALVTASMRSSVGSSEFNVVIDGMYATGQGSDDDANDGDRSSQYDIDAVEEQRRSVLAALDVYENEYADAASVRSSVMSRDYSASLPGSVEYTLEHPDDEKGGDGGEEFYRRVPARGNSSSGGGGGDGGDGSDAESYCDTVRDSRRDTLALDDDFLMMMERNRSVRTEEEQARHGARFSTVIYARGWHCFRRLLA